jgi:hypothetical protein
VGTLVRFVGSVQFKCALISADVAMRNFHAFALHNTQNEMIEDLFSLKGVLGASFEMLNLNRTLCTNISLASY